MIENCTGDYSDEMEEKESLGANEVEGGDMHLDCAIGMQEPCIAMPLHPSCHLNIYEPILGSKVINSSKKSQKVQESRSWRNIFSACKLVVSMTPRDTSNNEIMIRYAQSDFRTNFGFLVPDRYSNIRSSSDDDSTQSSHSANQSNSQLPIPLKRLFGKATLRFSTLKLQNAMLTNKSFCEYMNLYNFTGVPLSCHVTLTSICGQANTSKFRSLGNGEKWAIMTIRSASVVGNSKLSGIGILGVDRVPSTIIKHRLDANRRFKEKSSKSLLKSKVVNKNCLSRKNVKSLKHKQHYA